VIQALVLAAGRSRRMGQFKPLLPLGSSTALALIVETFRTAGVEDIIAVSGHRHRQTAEACADLRIDCVANPDHRLGMYSSVLAGARSLSGSCRAFFVLPADIPLVRPWTIRRLVQAFEETRPAAALPCFLDKRGHPPLISSELLPTILDHDGSGGLRRVLKMSAKRIAEIDVFDRNILLDLDRPDDLPIARQRLNRLRRLDRGEAMALAERIIALPPVGLAHGQAVGLTAEAMARAANRAGASLDPELAFAGGLLHDAAKGVPNHEEAGARLLLDMGLEDLAPIVAVHRDIELSEADPIAEPELVSLADKLVRGRERISLEERFQELIDRHRNDSEKLAAIKRRRANARTVRARVERLIGHDLGSVLPDLSRRRLAEPP